MRSPTFAGGVRILSVVGNRPQLEVGNLASEGITQSVHLVGEVMADWDRLVGSDTEAIVAAVEDR